MKLTPQKEFYMLIVSTLADGVFNGLSGSGEVLNKSPEEILRTGIVGAIGLMMTQTDLEEQIQSCMGCTKKMCDRCKKPQARLMMAAVAISKLKESEQNEIARNVAIEHENREISEMFSGVEKFL